jgi:hypothetical protein
MRGATQRRAGVLKERVSCVLWDFVAAFGVVESTSRLEQSRRKAEAQVVSQSRRLESYLLLCRPRCFHPLHLRC